jgi:hypothetical protein
MRRNPRYTALHFAAYSGREAVVALLLAEPRFTKLTAMTNVGHRYNPYLSLCITMGGTGYNTNQRRSQRARMCEGHGARRRRGDAGGGGARVLMVMHRVRDDVTVCARENQSVCVGHGGAMYMVARSRIRIVSVTRCVFIIITIALLALP